MSLLDNISKDKKTKYQKLEEKLALKKKSAWEQFTDRQKKEAFKLCDDYKSFLDKAKTEREAVKEIEAFAKKKDFSEIGEAKELIPGSRVYDIYRNKNAALVIAGKKPITEGARIIVSHVDSPRIDLKPHPLYEDSGIAMMKTHYYGGIKKFHWVNRPFALHGVVTRKDGTTIDFIIGESDKDPVFVISDLLIHLSRKSVDKRVASEALKGEELNIIAGNIPVTDDKVKQKVKLAVLEHLYDKYGIIEEDFASAEIEAVPAEKARDIGFDRAFVGAYGHDDKSGVFSSLSAACSVRTPEYTTIVLFIDKEEIGSYGNTSARSLYLQHFVGKLLELHGKQGSIKEINETLMKSQAISSDICSAVNPTFKDVYDVNNSFLAGFGITLQMYTGAGGKYYSSHASCEFAGKMRKMLNDNKVPWQYGEEGKVDEGGGGTLALYLSRYGMDIIDISIPVLGVHSPFEVVSKADMYSAYMAYAAFLES